MGRRGGGGEPSGKCIFKRQCVQSLCEQLLRPLDRKGAVEATEATCVYTNDGSMCLSLKIIMNDGVSLKIIMNDAESKRKCRLT